MGVSELAELQQVEGRRAGRALLIVSEEAPASLKQMALPEAPTRRVGLNMQRCKQKRKETSCYRFFHTSGCNQSVVCCPASERTLKHSQSGTCCLDSQKFRHQTLTSAFNELCAPHGDGADSQVGCGGAV